MSEIALQVCLLREGATAPSYATAGAAGLDLSACLDAPLTLQPRERKLVPTGLAMALAAGYEGQVRPRSGLAAKHGVTVLNAPGTIDADYRGEVKVLLVNLGQDAFTIVHGDRIAQLVIARVAQASVAVVSEAELGTTERGVGGFGSTGVTTRVTARTP
jgi:dUTP pyrophosphatase